MSIFCWKEKKEGLDEWIRWLVLSMVVEILWTVLEHVIRIGLLFDHKDE